MTTVVEIESSEESSLSGDELDFGANLDAFSKILECCQSQVSITNPPKEKDKDVVVLATKIAAKNSEGSRRPRRNKNRRNKQIPVVDNDDQSTQEIGDSDDSSEPAACREFAEFVQAEKSRPLTKTGSKRKSDEGDDDVQVLDISLDSTPIMVEEYTPSINVRVQWQKDIYKFRMTECDKVSKLRDLLGEAVSVPVNEIVIALSDDPGSEWLEDKKTLNESGVTYGVSLEAFRHQWKSPAAGGKRRAEKDLSMVTLKLQVDSNKKSDMFLSLKKTAPFKELQKMCATKLNVEVDHVMFRIDGDIVDLDDTPESMDLEDDDCVDVLIRKL